LAGAAAGALVPGADLTGVSEGIGSIIGGLVGYLAPGFIATTLAQKGQTAAADAIAPDSEFGSKQEAAEEAAHPAVSAVTSLLTLGKPNPFKIVRAAQTIASAEGRAALSGLLKAGTDKEAQDLWATTTPAPIQQGVQSVLDTAHAGAINAAFNAANQIQTGNYSATDLLKSAAEGTLFNQPWIHAAHPATKQFDQAKANDNNPETQEAPPQEAEQPLPPPVPPEEAQGVGVGGTPEIVPPSTTGVPNAVQIRSSTPPVVGETPGDSAEVGGRIPAPKETALPQEIQKAQAPPVVAPQVIPPEAVPTLRAKLFVNMQGRTMNIAPDAFQTADPHLKLVLGQDAPSWKALADAGVVKAEPNPDGTVAVKVNLESPLNPGGAAADLPPALKAISDQNNSREAFARAQAEADAKKAAAQPPQIHPLADALEKYEGTGEIQTIPDLVNHVDGLIGEGKAPESLSEAVETYRQEQEDDRKLGGRGDMDEAGENFIKSVRAAIPDSNHIPIRVPGVTLDTTDHVGEGKLFESPEVFEQSYAKQADAEVKESRDEFLKRSVCASRIKMKIAE
jgi:hypothetical protein